MWDSLPISKLPRTWHFVSMLLSKGMPKDKLEIMRQFRMRATGVQQVPKLLLEILRHAEAELWSCQSATCNRRGEGRKGLALHLSHLELKQVV